MSQQDHADEIETILISDGDVQSLEKTGAFRLNWATWKGDPPKEYIVKNFAGNFSIRVRLSGYGNSDSERIYRKIK